jgi:hypothetical protein
MIAPRFALVACIVGLIGGGCESCSRKNETVPFGRDRASSTDPSDDERPPDSAFVPREGVRLDPGTRELTVAGGRYTTPRGAIHVALPLDFDRDDDEDALLIVSQESTLSLVVVKNDRGVLTTETLGTFEMPEGCLFDDGKLDQVEPEHVVFGARARCAFGEASAGGMVTLLPSPRVRKKIWLDAPTDESGTPLRLVFSGADRDEDGHLDLVVVALGEATPPVELVWLDRPGGFSLVDAEPRQTLEGIHAAGRDAKDPEVVRAEAMRLRAVSAALCREAKMPRLRVDDAYGVPCGRDYVGLADALRVGALVASSRFDEAIDLDRAVRDQAEKEIVRALDDAWRSVRPSRITFDRVTDAPKEAGMDEWTSGLGFDEDGALVKRGLLTQRFTFEGRRAQSEIVIDRNLPIVDPEGRYAVESVVRDCASVRARVVALDAETGAIRPGGVRRELEIAPPGLSCERGDGAPRTWEVLGWTPQGLVARHGTRRRVVPLSVDAEPAGEPFELGEDEPLPSPIRGAHITRDGSVQLDSVPGAILVLREGSAPLVVRDDAWGSAPLVRSAALSGDGRRLAVVVNDGLYIGSLPNP